MGAKSGRRHWFPGGPMPNLTIAWRSKTSPPAPELFYNVAELHRVSAGLGEGSGRAIERRGGPFGLGLFRK